MLAPAGALALCPQTLTGYTGTSIPLAPAPSSTGFRAGLSPANKRAGQGWSLEAGRVGNQGVREGDEGPPESITQSQAGCWAEVGHIGFILLRRLREVKSVVQSPTARNLRAEIGSKLTSEVFSSCVSTMI